MTNPYPPNQPNGGQPNGVPPQGGLSGSQPQQPLGQPSAPYPMGQPSAPHPMGQPTGPQQPLGQNTYPGPPTHQTGQTSTTTTSTTYSAQPGPAYGAPVPPPQKKKMNPLWIILPLVLIGLPLLMIGGCFAIGLNAAKNATSSYTPRTTAPVTTSSAPTTSAPSSTKPTTTASSAASTKPSTAASSVSTKNFVAVGECYEFTETATGDDFKKVACADATAAGTKVNWKVSTVAPYDPALKCPSEDYVNYSENAGANPRRYACLVPNLAVNACYTENDKHTDFLPAACTTPKSYKVTQKLPDATSPCAAGEHELRYPNEKLTYCLLAQQ